MTKGVHTRRKVKELLQPCAGRDQVFRVQHSALIVLGLLQRQQYAERVLVVVDTIKRTGSS